MRFELSEKNARSPLQEQWIKMVNARFAGKPASQQAEQFAGNVEYLNEAELNEAEEGFVEQMKKVLASNAENKKRVEKFIADCAPAVEDKMKRLMDSFDNVDKSLALLGISKFHLEPVSLNENYTAGKNPLEIALIAALALVRALKSRCLNESQYFQKDEDRIKTIKDNFDKAIANFKKQPQPAMETDLSRRLMRELNEEYHELKNLTRFNKKLDEDAVSKECTDSITAFFEYIDKNQKQAGDGAVLRFKNGT